MPVKRVRRYRFPIWWFIGFTVAAGLFCFLMGKVR